MRGVRARRDQTSMANPTTTSLIQPRMENLTIGPIPTDATNVVISRPNDLGITDKLNALIAEYQSEMVQLPSTGVCASSITAKFPREFLQALYDMLNVNNNGCLQETQTFLQLLVSYLSSTPDGYVNIPRNFWTQIGRVFNELNVNESKINMYAAAMRSMSMALSTDVQSIPSNNMLISTLESISELDTATVKPIDSKFEENFPESIIEQPDPNEIMTEVINNIPTTVGESSSNPPTNIIDMDASTSSENIQLHDLDDSNNLEGQAYIGLKELFSMKTLGVPISRLKLIEGGTVKALALQDVRIPQTGTLNADGKKVDFTFSTVKAYVQNTVDVSGVDVSKSLLEQDWALIPEGASRMIDGQINYVSATSLITNTGQRATFPEETRFKGVHTKKTYSMVQAKSLGSALSGLWNKVVSMKLPSPAHIQTGTSILAAGLGAAGSIFGSSGLVTASKVVGSLSEGLGSFIANLKPANGLAPPPQASITKNALTVVPGVIEAGKSIYEGVSVSAQHQRIKLSGMKNAVENGYIMPSTELIARSRVRRTNNIFG